MILESLECGLVWIWGPVVCSLTAGDRRSGPESWFFPSAVCVDANTSKIWHVEITDLETLLQYSM